ncbi:hypothetical protein AWL63_18435 [Sphingomonas panacis]|uniref:Uncharacterized protein n=2 Tax=Sphingomonas panacis TaxID=1560345 RepID=A0A1B3ZDW3_9SPHN|nr:hypothetical protein AWL63_18435 [Sphingomonas panacis]
MLDELDAIAGGEGEDTDEVADPDEEIVVTGRRITMTPINLNLPPIIIDLPPDYDPDPGQLGITGDPCPVVRSELNEALSNLEAGSPTGALIIAAARESYVNINLMQIGVNYADDFYDDWTKTIYWDPFSALSGVNSDGVTYFAESPTMLLMHELVHWANPQLGHEGVWRLTNEIAREMNANTGTSHGTNRDNGGGSNYIVTDTDSTNWPGLGVARPGC